MGYFEGLAEQVLLRIRQEEAAEELSNLSPLLSKLSRQHPFQVPEGYFENTSTVTQVASPRQVPVRSIWQRQWFRYTAAVAAVATGVFVWIGQSKQPDAPDTAEAVIQVYQKEIQQLDEQQETLLQEFVSAGMSGQETARIDNTPINAQNLLADVSEEELNEFMEQSEYLTTNESNE
jgi:hypothetical protein